jgi:hypothetical protein
LIIVGTKRDMAPSGRMCRLHPSTVGKEDGILPLAQSKRPLTEGSRPPCDAGRKSGVIAKARLWPLLHEDPPWSSRVLFDQVAQTQSSIGGRVRQLQR